MREPTLCLVTPLFSSSMHQSAFAHGGDSPCVAHHHASSSSSISHIHGSILTTQHPPTDIRTRSSAEPLGCMTEQENNRLKRLLAEANQDIEAPKIGFGVKLYPCAVRTDSGPEFTSGIPSFRAQGLVQADARGSAYICRRSRKDTDRDRATPMRATAPASLVPAAGARSHGWAR